MKNVLITGINGFVGRYLSEYLLLQKGYKVFGTTSNKKSICKENPNLLYMELTDIDSIKKVINKVKPNLVFHLAAQSSVKKSWDSTCETFFTNSIGTVNLLNVLVKLNPKPKILLIGSSEEYGEIFKNNVFPDENSACFPLNPYAISKLTQTNYGIMFSKAYDMNIIVARSFNQCGPMQSEQFVISDFCKQVAKIEKGLQEPVIKVGNLNSYRDFIDVRDIVKIYYSVILNGSKSEIYNIGSGKIEKLSNILELICRKSNRKIMIDVDSEKIRPIEIQKCGANIEKIREIYNMNELIPLENTIEDTLNYWRKNI